MQKSSRIAPQIAVRRLIVAVMCLAFAACTPLQPIRTIPSFIHAAVGQGDKVRIVDRNDNKIEFEVSEVTDSALVGSNHTIEFRDIKELYLRSRDRPEYPCGDEAPLGCSVPYLTDVALQTLAETTSPAFLLFSDHRETFYHDCVQHDFCYRHGFETYGKDQEFCDDDFYTDLRDTCGINPFCLFVAKQYHIAVSRAGAQYFRIDDSTYCEYDSRFSDEIDRVTSNAGVGRN